MARSSTEDEYKSLANTVSRALWVVKLLRELGESPLSPILLRCDSISAISLTANPVLHSTTKHVAVSYHFVRERVADGSLQVNHVPSKEQADILTKALPNESFCYLSGKLMRNIPISLRGGVENNTKQN